ncbi:histidine phosphatase family protein [Dokdonella sp. MW10]|uniref:histidine phosphatase family protein n=1 Tax=Dokdonella sp. MW10 TaxID=2992926 RepID=UPI003F8098B2
MHPVPLPQRLWIVRHGQSAGNVARDSAEAAKLELIDLATRDADVPLSDLGMEQAKALAAWMARQSPEERPERLMTSPFVRSVQTCRAMADALGIAPDCVHIDERLREKEFGVLDRYTTHGIRSTFPELSAQRQSVGKFYFRPPGGESWCDVILRLRSVYDEIKIDHAGRRVMIVAHQVIVNCFRYILERLDEATILAIDREGDVPNGAFTEYALAEDAQTLMLVRANMVPEDLAAVGATRAPDAPAGPR